MKKLMDEYGSTILVVIVIILLLGVVVFSMRTGGPLDGAFAKFLPQTDGGTSGITLTMDELDDLTRRSTLSASGEVESVNGTVESVIVMTNGAVEVVEFDEEKGIWSAVVHLSEGSNVIVVQATDATGETASVMDAITRDSIGPDLTVDALPNVTNNPYVVVAGTVTDDCGVASLVVTVGGMSYNVDVESDGSWSLGVDLVDGDNDIVVKATDKAGNSTTKEISVVCNSNGPELTLDELPDVTNNSTLTVAGSASDEVGIAFVVVTVGTTEYPATVEDDGKWSAEVVLPVAGQNDIKVMATNTLGNYSRVTDSVILDTTPPELALNALEETTALEKITVSGKVSDENGVDKVIVKVGDTETEAVVDANGNWSAEVKLAEGDNSIEVTATDKAGNTATKSDAIWRLISVDVPTAEGTLTYNGSAQSPNWNGYDSAKMTVSGATGGTNAGTYSAIFTPKAGYQWSDGTTTAKTVSWEIGKAEGKVVLSATGGPLECSGTGTFTVVTNLSGGTLSVKSSDTGMVTVGVSGNTVTMTAGADGGYATITVTSAATTNYTEASATYAVTVANFYEDDDGGVTGVVPPEDEPETPEEIPEEALPELIAFTGGTFEKNTSYTPGTYEEVPYEITYTRTKYPVSYRNIIWSQWEWEEDADGNEYNLRAKEISLDDIDEQYSTWIVYDFETDEALEMDGVKGDSVELWTIYDSDDDSLEHAVYLAAYLQKSGHENVLHIAKWNGTKYEAYDADDAVGAVTVFTETYTVTGTQRVQITAPSSTTDYVYIPGSTLTAEKGMTWEQWLVSEYNTTGLTEPVIRDVDYNEISLDEVIEDGESYSIMDETSGIVPGLYQTGTNYGTLLYSWDELISNGWITEGGERVPGKEDNLAGDLVISDSVTSIGGSAFEYCTGLTSVEIPDSVTSIGATAFASCTGLTSVVIPDSVTSIGSSAFYCCTGLTSVEIPDSVTSIGDATFDACESLTSVVIPDSVTSIGRYAFYGCTGLTSVVIPDSVTSIGSSAFQNCTELTSVEIPDSVTSIGDATFDTCESLTSVVIPDSVTSIGDDAFYGCTGLTSVEIPDSVTSIGEYAFYGCTGLTSVEISDSVTSIGIYAFARCTGLTSVVIPDSVTSIGATAFASCTGLTSISVDSGNTVYHSDGNCLIETASKTLVVGCKTSVIPSDGSVTSIGSSAFDGCSGLTSVGPVGSGASLEIPDSVTSIGDDAFSDCTGLTSVVIPDSVTSIGNYAFYDCTGLTSVTIGSGVTKIGRYAFRNCSALTSATFKDTSTWYYTSSSSYTNGTKVTVTNASTAATYLRSTYATRYWYKS